MLSVTELRTGFIRHPYLGELIQLMVSGFPTKRGKRENVTPLYLKFWEAPLLFSSVPPSFFLPPTINWVPTFPLCPPALPLIMCHILEEVAGIKSIKRQKIMHPCLYPTSWQKFSQFLVLLWSHTGGAISSSPLNSFY